MPKSKPNRRKTCRQKKSRAPSAKRGEAHFNQWKQVYQAIAAVYPSVSFTDHGTSERYPQVEFSLSYNLASVEGFSLAILFEQMEKGDAPPTPNGALAWIAGSCALMSLVADDITPPAAKIQHREFAQ